MNPRWKIWMDLGGSGETFDYIQWINFWVPKYLKSTGQNHITDHNAFTNWLERMAQV
jgi:hypothetical protein